MKLSIVVPVYNCCESLESLYDRLHVSISKITNDFEILMVNDASHDNAWIEISRLALRDRRVKGINLSRNFGQHYAIQAGLDYVNGEVIVVMDCDLQDQPEEIIKLYTKLLEGYDIVYGCSEEGRNTLKYEKFFSKLYYKIYDYLRDDLTKTSCGASFTIFNKKVLNSLKELKEFKIEFLGLLRIIGFKQTTVKVISSEREIGESSYTFIKKVNHALVGIIANSTKLLRLGVFIGTSIAILSFFVGFYIILNKFFIVDYEAGWSSIITSIFFMGGLIMILIGIIGLYLENIFYEVKRRPRYFIDEMININKDKYENL